MTGEVGQLLIGASFVLFSGTMLLVGLVTGKMIAPSGTFHRSMQPLHFWRVTAIYVLGTVVGLFVAGSALSG
jgi:hypothetical protein